MVNTVGKITSKIVFSFPFNNNFTAFSSDGKSEYYYWETRTTLRDSRHRSVYDRAKVEDSEFFILGEEIESFK